MMLTRATRTLHKQAHPRLLRLAPGLAPEQSCRATGTGDKAGRRHASTIVAQRRSISTSLDAYHEPSDSIPLLSTRVTTPQNGSIDLATFMPTAKDIRGTDSKWRSSFLGVNIDEAMQNLRACLSVGRYNRAEAIIRRLASACLYSVDELQEANNTFLRYYMHSLFRGTEGLSLSKLQTWFEVDMRQLGISADATTIAIMTRTAFLLAHAKSRERTIRRYLHIAEEMNMLDATMSSGEYLPEEFNELCRIRADLFNVLPREVVEVQDAPHPVPSESPQRIDEPVTLVPTDAKSAGLAALLQSMRSFYIGQDISDMNDVAKTQWQIALEQDIVAAELQRWRTDHAEMLKVGVNSVMKKKSMEAMLWEWQEKLHSHLSTYISQLQKDNINYMEESGAYLEQVGAEKLAAVTILETIRSISKHKTGDPPKIYVVLSCIGESLEFEVAVKHFMQRKETGRRRLKQKSRQAMLKVLRREEAQAQAQPSKPQSTLNSQLVATMKDGTIRWPTAVRMRIAAMLLSKLIEVAKIQVPIVEMPSEPEDYILEPALSHTKIFENGHQHGAVKAHPELVRKLASEPPPALLAHQLPMVAKPSPWFDAKGGYLRYPASLMRLKDHSGIQDMYLHAAIQEGAMSEVFKGLNALGSIAWRINRQLFDVMAELWNTGKAITNFPPANPDVTFAPKPPEDASKQEIARWRRIVKDQQNQLAGYHSNRCFINAQMEIARAYLGHDFYLPHNIDFRGRAYPIGGIFHHMGADNVRALFQFSEGKVLGEHGLFWLRTHLANKFGYDKARLDEREQFVTDNWDDIKDSVENPITGRQWWLKAEDPWQCLAACFEVVAAMASPDPQAFVSRLPIHQDGTCNGLQHYAALGGDVAGAAQVNLVPGDRPGDIYSEIARSVKADVEADAQAGERMAQALQGLIGRKVVKQPVMTYAYGVTFYGARLQIAKRLDEIRPVTADTELSNLHLAHYLTGKVFKHFGTLFKGATKLQHWLAVCAGRISLAISPQQIEQLRDGSSTTSKKGRQTKPKFQSAVIWTTPLNLPVVQPYRQTESDKSVSTALQSLKVFYPSNGDEVLQRKQMAGFPPNFIHSLDASHMLMSAAKCHEKGIIFASVHDSFWTHACDVPKLNATLRDAFVELHSENTVARLDEEFRARYRFYLCQKSVPLNSQFGRKIMAMRRQAANDRKAATNPSKKASNAKDAEPAMKPNYSVPSLDELSAEYDRLCLSFSENPGDQVKAKTIITAAAEYEALDANHPDLQPSESPNYRPKKSTSDAKTGSKGELNSQLTAAEFQDIAAPKQDTPLEAGDDTPYILQHPVVVANAMEDAASTPSAHDHDTPSTKKPSSRRARSAKSSTAAQDPKPLVAHGKVFFWAPLDFPAVPERGDFDINLVKQSTYFFS